MTQQTMAQRAIALLANKNSEAALDTETFTRVMHDANLPFLAITLTDPDGSVPDDISSDIVLFEDGSGFFADDASTSEWTPWPLDGVASREDEMLPIWTDITDHLEFGVSDRFVQQADVASETLDAHLASCARSHPDAPEILRARLVSPYRDISWSAPGAEARIQSLLSKIASLVLPSARQITIFADSRGGRTHVQERNDTAMISMLGDMSSSLLNDPTMSYHYAGMAYAEIAEADADYPDIVQANTVIAPISRMIMDKIGTPVGWHTDYNDGPSNRLSGHNAYGESIVIDLVPLSAHARIGLREETERDLDALGLVDDFRALLDAGGFEFPVS